MASASLGGGKGISDIAGHHVPRVKDRGMTQRAADINGDIHCTTADIHDTDAQFTFIFR